MALSWRTRRRLALLVLVVGLPLYILVAVAIVAQFERPSILVELAVYVGLGIVWVLPLKPIFKGIGQPEPEDERRAREGRR